MIGPDDIPRASADRPEAAPKPPPAAPQLPPWMTGLPDPDADVEATVRRVTQPVGPLPPAGAPEPDPPIAWQHPPAPERGRRRGRRLGILVGASALLVAVVVAGWVLLRDAGGDATGTTKTPGATAAVAQPTEPASERTTASAPPSTPPRAPSTSAELAAMRTIGQTTSCSAADDDAATIVTYDAAAFRTPGGEDAASVIGEALADIELACDPLYASDVARRVSLADRVTQATVATTRSFADARNEFPASPGALAVRDIIAPSRNISCELSLDGVGCSILDREYPPGEDCADRVFSAVVMGGTASRACGTEWPPGSDIDYYELQYGETTTYGNVACTVERSGMLCWDLRTGASILLAAAAHTISN